MKRSNRPKQPKPRLAILRWTDQLAVAVLTSSFLVFVLGYWVAWQMTHGELIDIQRVEAKSVDFQIELNQADWPELMLLPGIGPRLAQRIVQSRQQDGPFTSVDELTRVRGIGPKKVEAIRTMVSANHSGDGRAHGGKMAGPVSGQFEETSTK